MTSGLKFPTAKEQFLASKPKKKTGTQQQTDLASGRVTYTPPAGKKTVLSQEEQEQYIATQKAEIEAMKSQKTKPLNIKGTANVEALRTAQHQYEQQKQEQEAAMLKAPAEAEAQQALSQLGLTEEQKMRQFEMGEGALGTMATLGAGAAGALAGGKAGAAIGTAVAPGPGTIIGAAGGATIGFIGGIGAKLTYSRIQDTNVIYGAYEASTSNMNWILTELNAGRMGSARAVEMWDEEISNILAAERILKQMTDTAPERLLTPGGLKKRQKIEGAIRRLGYLEEQLILAINVPDPNKIFTYSPDTEE